MKYLLMLIFVSQPLAAQTFTVIHERRLWRDGGGKIEISDDAIEFIAEKEEDSRSWTYRDIQYFDRIHFLVLLFIIDKISA